MNGHNYCLMLDQKTLNQLMMSTTLSVDFEVTLMMMISLVYERQW